jgi:predicted aldo/keto reductase-like oxidoreductase
MDSKEMLTDLNSQAENLRKDLIDLEQLFNMKKEQYLKVQGAVEALTALEETP